MVCPGDESAVCLGSEARRPSLFQGDGLCLLSLGILSWSVTDRPNPAIHVRLNPATTSSSPPGLWERREGVGYGFGSSFSGAALSGSGIGDALKAGISSAVIAGITAGATYQVGTIFDAELGISGGYAKKLVAHGIIQGTASAASGGKFEHGFIGGAIGEFGVSAFGPIGGIIAAGTAAEIGGGKFANGALSAAFVYVFNHAAHSDNSAAATNLTSEGRIFAGSRVEFAEGVGLKLKIFGLTIELENRVTLFGAELQPDSTLKLVTPSETREISVSFLKGIKVSYDLKHGTFSETFNFKQISISDAAVLQFSGTGFGFSFTGQVNINEALAVAGEAMPCCHRGGRE